MARFRPHTTPLLFDGDIARKLPRIPLDSPPFPELKLQELLAQYPELLPVDELEPAFSTMICLGREIPTAVGPIDLLYISPDGYLTIVETKLWSNSEARRRVVAQILDYAKELCVWDFDTLDNAVRKGIHIGQGLRPGILDIMRSSKVEGFDERTFADDLVRHLRQCRILLLIVGEGIREGMEALATHLQSSAALRFSLALVEMALHRLNPDQDWPLLIQPRILARTTEIVRAVIDIRNATNSVVTIGQPDANTTNRNRRTRITEEAFFERMRTNGREIDTESLGEFLREIEAIGLIPNWNSNSVSFKLSDPAGTGKQFTVIVIEAGGNFYLGWLHQARDEGYDASIATDYLNGVHKLCGGTINREFLSLTPAPITTLLKFRSEGLALMTQFIGRIQAEAKRRGAD